VFFVFNGPMNKRKAYRLASNYWLLITILLIILLGCCLWLILRPPAVNLTIKGTIQENTSTQVTKEATLPVEYFSSFSDSFSGTARLDQNRTTLVRDSSAMVFTFQPNFSWQELGSCLKAPDQCRLIDSQLNSKQACLGGQCLAIKDDQLFYQRQRLTLPISSEIKLINLSISALADRWLVGGVQELPEQQYQPLAWLFDGHNFTTVNLTGAANQPIKSKYLGHLAAGGRAESFLVLYSAYDGLAWQVNGSETHNLSRFFGIRVNAGGFQPKIIYSGQGQDTTWYVFNQAGQPARWLKFWQNGTVWIEGGLDLSNSLPTGSQEAYFLTDPANKKLQVKVIDSQGQAQFWLVDDLGFIAPESGQVVSNDLIFYNRAKPQITGATIANALGGWFGIKQQWSLSLDGQQWQNVDLGQRLDFTQPTEQLWWRWQVESASNQWSSPCLKMVTINYYRLE